MYKKFFILFFVIASLFLLTFSVTAIDVSAKGAVLLEMQSKKIAYGNFKNLFEKFCDKIN